MKEFLTAIGRRRRYVVAELFINYLTLGIGVIMLGSVLPQLRAAYEIDYKVGGSLLSAQSIGYLAIGLISGTAAVKMGMKRAYLALAALMPIGIAMLLTGRAPLWLLAAMLLTGFSKGGVTDYNNRIMSDYANGSATPLNMLHAFFAFGACVAPLLVLACQRTGENGWRLALIICLVLLVAGVVFGLFMHTDNIQQEDSTQSSGGYGFFRDPLFWQTTALGFFYQAIEAPMMGWLTTFYIDSGVLHESAAQIVTSLLWISLLVGRFSCSVIAAKFRPWQMMVVMCSGIAVFLVLMVCGTSLPVLLIATIGLGLCMSGMYGTSVANAGDMFSRYPACMGLFVTITGIGGALAPAAIGIVADRSGIRMGFATLLVAAAMLVIAALCNMRYFKKR